MSRIEYHVQKAGEYADKGHSKLRQAEKKKKAAIKVNFKLFADFMMPVTTAGMELGQICI